MPAQRKIALALLTLLVSATLTTAWTNKHLQNWNKGWSHNIFGEPLDDKTACDGKPCTRYNLTKPVVPPIDRSAKLCKVSASDEQAFMCNHVPKNATLVSNQEFEHLFPTLGRPKLPPIPQRNRPLQKRSRWTLDTGSGSFEMHVWKKTSLTYSITAAPGLSGRIAGLAAAIEGALSLWVESCGGENESGYNAPIFDYWKYVPSASTASIWFYIAPDTACDESAALACAFFPHDYPAKRTTVMINNDKLKHKQENGAILTMAHEIGHVLGLVHEESNESRHVWVASDLDTGSIMKPNFGSIKGIKGISASDCLAMQYYTKGFPQPVSCKVHPTKGKICTKATLRTVSPKSVKVATGQHYQEKKLGGHDELLQDTDDETCLGSDINQYIVNTPLRSGEFGWFELGTSLSQCTAVRLSSKSNFFHAMQSDGNFVTYNIKTGQPVWYSGSAGLGTKGDYNIFFQEDGNLVIYDTKGSAVWGTSTWFGAPQTARLTPGFWTFSDDGVMDVTGTTGSLWSSHVSYTYGKKPIPLKGTGYCLDASFNTPGASAVIYQCIGNDNQYWDVFTDGTISNTKTGLCLDNTGGHKSLGNPVIVYTCNGGSNQKWQFLADGTIQNPATGLCLNNSGNHWGNGNTLQVWNCNKFAHQQWAISQ